MKQVLVSDWKTWRAAARKLLATDTPPDNILFTEQPTLLDDAPAPSEAPSLKVPKQFLEIGPFVASFRDPDRFNLLYRVLYRLTHGEPQLLQIDIDDDVRRLKLMEKAVRRDMHKMTAFVRFRRIETEHGEEFVAWHRPDHQIVEQTAPFFARRFGSLRWTIFTPDRSAFWDREHLAFGPGVPRSAAPAGDDLEELWKTYYGSIFNPARVKIKAMKTEMPTRHWATLPEADIISDLLLQADRRVVEMSEKQLTSAAPFVPTHPTLPRLVAAAKQCEGCDLYRHATQTVFGEGPAKAPVLMVGEQPGDSEDLAGKPFIGPAGKMLDRALSEAGIDRAQIYVTNAVKHFKFIERGKRRIHAKPGGIEISACRPWLEAEIDVISPDLIVCLGATAALSLMGREFRITRDRGTLFPHRSGRQLMATIHPSALLRMPERDRAEAEYALFVKDLALIGEHVPATRLSA